MTLQIQENFSIEAPVETVWAFLLNPENVVACMPGASLTQLTDENTFVGAVKLKIGAVSAQYQGTVTYKEKDETNYTVTMLATGNERGGGTATGTILTQLSSTPDGRSTEVSCESSIELTGRIIQVGRGMIEGVSAQIIKKYVNNVRLLLEVTDEVPESGATETAAPLRGTPQKEDSINVIAVVFKVIYERIARFFRQLLSRN